MRIPLGAKAWSMAIILSLAGCEGFPFVDSSAKSSSAGNGNPAGATTETKTASLPPAKSKRGAKSDDSLLARAVVGGSEAEVTRLLGEPGTVRNEPPAMVWQYAAGDCKLDVFFYFDIRNKDFRALSYKFYPDQPTQRDERTCLAGIRKRASR